ncbi:replication restart DNA helicase PriA [Jatrophihabitans endophyticus]|uniref:Probable replication restart protein PriA n=1 Tax=Jatrophihabitans endophyticus TaxID=1206085 RepID=A0A1M5LSE0_9ACTN|nr:primosomal protein N' [Jatrophihabitans endophyticus]SHG67896.1 replication restart DNA helicase PriA [Jatrophihabitans endophyticus]
MAHLLVDVALPHLDRPFDYLVPTELDGVVAAGSRVRVRFAGRLVDAYVLARDERSEHVGDLAYVERAVGEEPVLTAETTALFRAVADRWAGDFVDVVRLGVPSRHARAETSAPKDPGELPEAPPTGFDRYRAGPAFLTAVADGRAARAVWTALPDDDWAQRLAEAVRVAHDAGRGAVVVVPDARDLARLDAALTAALGTGRHVALAADLGPAERYRRWLAVRRGVVRVAVGTRAAAYAPVTEPGLLAIWDDGDDLHAEPRAPYPHARDVLALRSSLTGAALLVGGQARTAEAQLLVESGWAHEVVAERTVLRAAAPRVRPTGDDVEVARDPAAAAARLPSLAWRTTREALAAGRPVLVQVPRGGYVPSLACARDRTPARCAVCAGPLAARSQAEVPACRWCGRPAADWSCPTCGGRALRASVVGSARTAEELGRAFPGVPVRTSGGDRVLAEVDSEAAVVVATPGAEPRCEGGYGAVLLLDGWALLSRPDLRAAEEALRRWVNAASLVRPGGPVVVGADAGIPAVQALVRWDPRGFAARELAERAELGFPPAARMAALSGTPAAVAELVAAAELPASAQVVGPVPVDADTERVLVRVRRGEGAELARALKTAAAGRSARRGADPVRIALDPAELG